MNIVREFGYLTGAALGKRQSVSRWMTSAGGQCCAGSLGAGITGKPSDLFVIDDYCKNDLTANSATTRERLLREYESCCETRLTPKSAVIIVATRWHPSDLVSSVLKLAEQGGKRWEHISLPALAEENDPLGRAPGESIWPEKYPERYYLDRQRQLELLGQSYAWHSLYQQNPVSGNRATEWPSNYFPESMWLDQRPTDTPKLRVLSIDPSKGAQDKSGDYTALVLCDLMNDGTIIVESWIRRMTIEEMYDEILSIWVNRQPNGIVIESGAGQEVYGKVLIEKAKQISELPIPIYSFENRLNKIVRIRQGLSPLLAQRRLKFIKTTGNMILVSQLKSFPSDMYDDGADSLELSCQLFNHLLTGNRKAERIVLSA